MQDCSSGQWWGFCGGLYSQPWPQALVRGLARHDNLDASYDQGYSDGVAASGTLYTQEELDQAISNILTWGDTSGDGKIGLQEAINALRVTVAK